VKVDHRVVAVIGSEDDFAMLRKLDVLMVSTWIYFRMWFFPIYLIKEIWYQAQATGHPV
jgi:hypothetical protein